MRIICMLAAASVLTACASTQQPTTASIAPSSDTAMVLTKAETDDTFDCKTLAGRMQVRILDLRSAQDASGTTLLSRALKSGFSGIFGGSSAPASGDALAATKLKLEADNATLKANGCNSFDLDADLAERDPKKTPIPMRVAT